MASENILMGWILDAGEVLRLLTAALGCRPLADLVANWTSSHGGAAKPLSATITKLPPLLPASLTLLPPHTYIKNGRVAVQSRHSYICILLPS